MTTMLQRLADLRRRRAGRAFEALSARTRELHEAERVAGEVERAVAEHVAATRARERSLVAGVAGRTVRTSAILALEAELDAAALETAQRREAVARARAEIESRRSARARSLQEFQARQRAQHKIDYANDEQIARQARLRAESEGGGGGGDAEGAGKPP